MKVTPRLFKNGGEVDYGIDWQTRCRRSIRFSGGGIYEAYRHMFDTGQDDVVYRGSLRDVVAYANREFSSDWCRYEDMSGDEADE